MASNESDHNNSVANWTSSEIAERRSRGTNVIHGFSYRCRTHHSATDGSIGKRVYRNAPSKSFFPCKRCWEGRILRLNERANFSNC